MHRPLAGIAVLTATVLLAGCGGDEDNARSGTNIGKAEFVIEANRICGTGTRELATAFAEAMPETDEEQTQFFIDSVVPGIRDQVRQIRALGFPAADADTLDTLFDDVEAVLDRVADDPTMMLDERNSAFTDVNNGLTEYGLTTCGAN